MMRAESITGYRFGQFELQPAERRLLTAGAAVRIGRHAFDLLLVLVEHTGHLVTKDQLLERVWPRAVVEENTLQAHVSALRKILGRDAIATVSGRGYRFALEVTHVAAPPAAAPRHNLPLPLTSFVGREKQLIEVKRLLGTTRLLALTGAGGCGKTRLAMQLAAGVAPEYSDGVWLVELAAVTNAAHVPQAVATIVGVKEQAGTGLVQTLCDAVRPQRLLLILDNAEHLLGACAQLVDTMLRSSEQLVILVTTRERLGIAGELTYRVPSLAVPDATQDVTPERIALCESVQLFVERARLQRPHFAITPENANSVAAICRRLDGIPLAVELAAARARSMSVEEVNQRLDQRFSLLAGGPHTAMPRQRRLRSLVDWSYDLLSGSEKVLLNRVAVFAGGCTLADAEQVCSGEGIEPRDVLDLLAALADKSLLVADEHDGASRYRMLETIRHYARDQLRDSGEETQVQRRHFHCFSALAHEFNASVGRPALPALLRRLDMEHDNVRAALAWSTTAAGDSAGGLVMVSRLAWFWSFRGYLGEGRGWLSSVLAIAPGEQDPEVRARSLVGAGVLAAQQGDGSAAEALYAESLAIFKTIGHRAGIAYALRSLGNVAFARGDFAAARALKEESLAILRELGDRRAIGELLGVIGEVAAEQGDYEGARARLNECLASAREHGDQVRVAWTLAGLGSVAYYEKDHPTAGEYLRQALTIIGDLNDHWGTASFLEKFAAVLAALGAHQQAARIWGGAERLREEVGAPMPDPDRSRYDRQVEAGRAAMRDDEGFDEAWRAGRAMTTAQTVHYALQTGAKGRDRSATDSRRDGDPAASGTCAGTP